MSVRTVLSGTCIAHTQHLHSFTYMNDASAYRANLTAVQRALGWLPCWQWHMHYACLASTRLDIATARLVRLWLDGNPHAVDLLYVARATASARLVVREQDNPGLNLRNPCMHDTTSF